jgi:hypothetical protein
MDAVARNTHSARAQSSCDRCNSLNSSSTNAAVSIYEKAARSHGMLESRCSVIVSVQRLACGAGRNDVKAIQCNRPYIIRVFLLNLRFARVRRGFPQRPPVRNGAFGLVSASAALLNGPVKCFLQGRYVLSRNSTLFDDEGSSDGGPSHKHGSPTFAVSLVVYVFLNWFDRPGSLPLSYICDSIIFPSV